MRTLQGVITAIALVVSMPAVAAVQSFDERSAFEVAAGALSVEDFTASAGTNVCNPFDSDGPLCGGGPEFVEAGELTFRGFAQPYITPGLLLVEPELRFAVSSGGQLVTGARPGLASNFFFTLEATTDAPFTAFGATTRFQTKEIVLTLLDEANNVLHVVDAPPAAGEEFAFFGIVADEPFTTLRIRSGNDDFVNYDDVAFQMVPVPAALPLLATAIAGLALLRHRRRS